MFSTSPDVLRQTGAMIDLIDDTDFQKNTSITVNINTSHEYTPVFDEDITPPIPDTKDGAFLFTVNLLHWVVHTAMKLAGYALMLWLAWTVLTAGD